MPTPVNGTVQIKRGGIFFTEKGGSTEFEVVAAKMLERRMDTGRNILLGWWLELGDGSTVQWEMDVSKYGMEFLAKELDAMPDTRPKAQQTASGFRFGIQMDEAKDILLRLGSGMGNTVLPQSVTEMVVSSTEDFEIRMFNILYAEKRR